MRLLLPATMFVLLPALAGAGVVAANLGPGADWPGFFYGRRRFTDNVAALRRPSLGLRLARGRSGASTEGAGGLMHRLLRHAAEEILERHQAGGAAEDVVADLGFDIHHQLI